uniref:HNHc domain-containing protein n=1 Tax=Panagrellus redivivus TaxID=6233 RepID=A0A7E4V229_PANRE
MTTPTPKSETLPPTMTHCALGKNATATVDIAHQWPRKLFLGCGKWAANWVMSHEMVFTSNFGNFSTKLKKKEKQPSNEAFKTVLSLVINGRRRIRQTEAGMVSNNVIREND